MSSSRLLYGDDDYDIFCLVSSRSHKECVLSLMSLLNLNDTLSCTVSQYGI